jgi:hypothetical protein
MDRMGHASTRAALISAPDGAAGPGDHRRDQQARPGRAKAIGHAAGTRSARALLMASLMVSENIVLAARSQVERMTGIEPALSAWESAPFDPIRDPASGATLP